MNERVVESFELVFLRSETSQALSEHEYSQRVNVRNENIHSKVPLMFIDKKWVFDVFLNHKVLCRVNIIKSFSYENAFTL